jgi:hypothetical protein
LSNGVCKQYNFSVFSSSFLNQMSFLGDKKKLLFVWDFPILNDCTSEVIRY